MEDNPATLRVICRALRGAGLDVEPAENGRKAEQASLALHGRDFLLLTDVVLPDLDGRVLFDRLHSQNPSMRTLFISGYGEKYLLGRGFDPGETPILYKPFLPDELVAAVKAALAPA